jgi:hypothetical protein
MWNATWRVSRFKSFAPPVAFRGLTAQNHRLRRPSPFLLKIGPKWCAGRRWPREGGKYSDCETGAEVFTVYPWRDCVRVDVLAGEKFASVFSAMDSGRLDLKVFESGSRKFIAVVFFSERTGDTTDPQQHALADLGVNFVTACYIRHSRAPARFQR